MRVQPILLALLLTTSLAHAQAISPLGGSTNNAGSPPPALATGAPPAPATAQRSHRTMAERFAAANTTNDGKLTLEQAKAGHLRAVSRDFAAIDKTKKGYVTLDDIKAHQAEARAAHKSHR